MRDNFRSSIIEFRLKSSSMKKSTHRMSQLAPQFFASLNSRLTALQTEGCDVIRLDVGSPDLPPADHIIEALGDSASHPDSHGYVSHNGPLTLRQAWGEMYWRLYRISLDVEAEIVPLMGSKEGIFHLSLALLDPGDVVLVPDPAYPTYSIGAQIAGAETHFMPLVPGNDYLPDFKAIPESVSNRARLLWLNYPCNPTASVAPPGFFTEALDYADRYGLLVCHDAAYTQVTFDGYQAPSILQETGAKDVAIEFNTLSKSHNMAGWRVGAALGNPAALRSLSILKTHADSSHFLPILKAAESAMNGSQDWVVDRNAIYAQRRDLVVEALTRMGMATAKPLASLYVWSQVPQGWRSIDFAAAVLDGAQVSLTPGTVFGGHGEGYIRIALTAPLDRTAEAMQRIESWMRL
jgi:LL-diaminopimelate aminotransferase